MTPTSMAMPQAAIILTARPRLALAFAALLLAAFASLLLHRPHAGSFDTLAGRTTAGDAVAVSLRDGQVESIWAAGTQVRCASGWQVGAGAVRGADVSRRGTSFRATGTQRLPYPDGSTGSRTRIAVSGTSATSRAVTGTISYAVTLYREGTLVERCSAGPVSFIAR